MIVNLICETVSRLNQTMLTDAVPRVGEKMLIKGISYDTTCIVEEVKWYIPFGNPYVDVHLMFLSRKKVA